MSIFAENTGCRHHFSEAMRALAIRGGRKSAFGHEAAWPESEGIFSTLRRTLSHQDIVHRGCHQLEKPITAPPRRLDRRHAPTALTFGTVALMFLLFTPSIARAQAPIRVSITQQPSTITLFSAFRR